MTTSLERELVTALEAGARGAAPPDPDFASTVHRRVRRRRRRRAVVAAVSCVLAIAIGGAAVAVPALREDAPVTGPAAYPKKVPDLDDLRGPDRVWPRAVRTLPSRLPDGNVYRIAAVLPGDRYVIQPRSGDAFDSKPSLYDVPAGTVRPLFDPDGSSTDTQVAVLGVADDHVLWTIDDNDVWSTPLTGGRARELDLPNVGAPFAVAGNYLLSNGPVFEGSVQVHGLGVYRSPPAGGAPALVPNGTGFMVNPWTPEWASTRFRESRQGQILNVLTGERLDWTASSKTRYLQFCVRLWCGGIGRSEKAAIQRRDGSGYLEFDRLGTPLGSLVDGRFAIFGLLPRGASPSASRAEIWLIWDLQTGRAATVPGDFRSRNVSSGMGLARPFLAWERGGKLFLLEFEKIS